MDREIRKPEDKTRWGHRQIAKKTFTGAVLGIGSGTFIVAYGLLNYAGVEDGRFSTLKEHLVVILACSAPLGLFLFLLGIGLLFRSHKQGFLVRYKPAEISRALIAGNTNERRRASAELVILTDAEGRDLAMSALKDDDEEVRFHAVGALGISREGREDLLGVLFGRTGLSVDRRRSLTEQVGQLDPRVKAIKGWSARRNFFRVHTPFPDALGFFASAVFLAKTADEALPVVEGAIAAGARISMGYDVDAARHEWIKSGFIVVTKDGGIGPAFSNSPALPSRCVACGKPDPGHLMKMETSIRETEYQMERTSKVSLAIPCCFGCEDEHKQDIVLRLTRLGPWFRSRTSCPLMMVLQPLDARFIVEMKQLGWRAFSEKQFRKETWAYS